MKLLLILLVSGIFNNSHDITTLPSWGPYSKKYAGITHVEELQSGVCVDFFTCSSSYRRSNICIPNTLFESGCYPWEVSPDLKHICYRQEIEWKDRVYVDATYHVLDETSVLVKMHCVNNTDIPQRIGLHTVAGVRFAEDYPVFKLKGEEMYIPATSYREYEPAVRRHDYRLVYDGKLRGEVRDRFALGSSALQLSGKAGDRVIIPFPEHKSTVWMRFKGDSGKQFKLKINGHSFTAEGRGLGSYRRVALPEFKGELELVCESDGKLIIDGFIVGEKVNVVPEKPKYKPEVAITEGSYILKYEDCAQWYGVGWNFPLADVIQYEDSEIDNLLRTKANNHTNKHFTANGKGHFITAAQRPLMLKARSDTTVWNLITNGSRSEVEDRLAKFRSDEKNFTSRVWAEVPERGTGMTAAARVPAATASGESATTSRAGATASTTGPQTGNHPGSSEKLLPSAEPYKIIHRLMQATLMTNIVYPVYTQGQYIRHFTPGMNWNCLYTWDSGMISLALNDIDPVLAFENIRAYTTQPGCQSAFIHHGTPLPIQFFAFEEMCSKTCDKEKMAFLYPRLKQYYEYMAGKEPTATTLMPSGLLRTWDYFYNSGGWDDYPPQWYLREHPELYPYVAPVISTSCYIRAAKILRMTAERLGLKQDISAYDKDIKRFSEAILKNAWDEECGYFGYVEHNAEGKPVGLFKAKDGSNFNKGLDGVSPLLAGIGSKEQQKRMVDNIFSEKHLWTPYGISTVDKSASYYRIDGYWNGCIWMPHQFLQWKAMLDLGLAERAHQIAFTALDTWKNELNESYQCYEHFFTDSGRGAGWHNFSGLSSPVICWFTSSFRKGTISTGFDTMVTSQEWAEDHSSLKASLAFDKDAAGKTAAVIICMAPAAEYKASVNGKPAKTWSPYEGLVYVYVPESRKPAELKVSVR